MKTEGKVCVSVAIALLLLEGAARLLEPHLSQDVEEMFARSSIPDRLKEQKEAGNFTVLVVGNSLAQANLHERTLETELAAKGCQSPAIFFLTADGTNINEWNASYRKYFSGGTVKPDLLVWITGPGHLLDQSPASPERLAAYHTAASDIPRALAEWLPDMNSRARFLLGRVSRLFACRERVRPLLFYNFVPGFEFASEAMNRREHSLRQPLGRSTGKALRFSASLEFSGIPGERVVVVAAALPFCYEIPESVQAIARSRGIRILDHGASREWGDDAFPDGYHLSKNQSIAFTRETVSRLAPGRRFGDESDGSRSPR